VRYKNSDGLLNFVHGFLLFVLSLCEKLKSDVSRKCRQKRNIMAASKKILRRPRSCEVMLCDRRKKGFLYSKSVLILLTLINQRGKIMGKSNQF
jgi:hypothetical protein